MSTHAKIKAKLREIMGGSFNQPLQCKVKSVEGNSCTVSFAGMDFSKVRLRATLTSSSEQLLITPKVGSKVTVLSMTGELDDFTVIKVDQVEKIEYKQGSLTFIVDGTTGKVKIENGGVSMKSLMKDLYSIISGLSVIVPGIGPSTELSPDSIALLEVYNANIDQLLN